MDVLEINYYNESGSFNVIVFLCMHEAKELSMTRSRRQWAFVKRANNFRNVLVFLLFYTKINIVVIQN